MAIKTVLIEDNKTIQASLIPAMEELGGLEVIAVAETESEALHALERYSGVWQVAVVDLFLLEGSGLGVLRSCKNRAQHQKAFVLTNYPTDEIRQRCKELGADGVFDKSTELDTFFDSCAAITPNSP
ncbi:MAG: hypothetical protein JWQ73_871 [Variovorax sp.]|jgi:DNA-binding NarL/FixJ family response regulator|nr:hypothetical protein [Variovorax sp.]